MSPPAVSPLVGNFILRTTSISHTGLAAHDAAELLRRADAESAQVYRIHRIDEAGNMELVGVERSSFDRELALQQRFAAAAEARRVFDGLEAAAGTHPPPGRVRLLIFHDRPDRRPFVVALIHCEACGPAVADWMGRAAPLLGRFEGPSPAGGFPAPEMQIIRQATLEPAPRAE
jgi:hypothetical protein